MWYPPIDRVIVTLVMCFAVAPFAPAPHASAQGTMAPGTGMLGGIEPSGNYPPESYYLGLRAYRDGDITTAVDLFENAARGGRRTIEGRWLDSVPALAMQAECYYELGDCVGAANLIDEVTGIVIRNSGFVARVNWNELRPQQNAVVAKRAFLWPQARAINVMPTPRRITFRAGKRLTEGDLVRGGTIEELNLRPVDMVEVLRTIAVASYRRRVLYGPLSQDDPVMRAVLDSLSIPADVTMPQARGLVGSAQGAAYFGAGRDDKALSLTPSATVGNFSHPISPVVMLSGLQSLASKDDVAVHIPKLLHLANVAAAVDQPEWIGPALALAAGYSDGQSAEAVANAASQIAVAMDRQSRMASMHAMVAAADAWVSSGNLDGAFKALMAATAVAQKRGVDCRRIEAYAAYVAARLAAASPEGFSTPRVRQRYETAMGQVNAFAFQSKVRRTTLTTCPRIFQSIRLAPMIGQRYNASDAGKMVATYVGDSPTWLWRTDPVDALATTMFDRSDLHWARLKVATSAGNSEEVLRATDDALADRFFHQTELGGRLHQARSMAWSEDDSLPQRARRFRDKHPAMKQLHAVAMASAADPAAAGILESAATSVALMRQRLPRCALPPLGEENPMKDVPPKTAVLAFVDTGDAMVATLTVNGKARQWVIPEAVAVRKATARYLQMIGVGKSRGLRLPPDDQSREACDEMLAKIRQILVPDDQALLYLNADPLWIIPDGALWYLPFEAMPIDDDGTRLGETANVCYSPTPGCVRFPAGPSAKQSTVAIAADQFFAPRDGDQNEATVDAIMNVLQAPIRLAPNQPGLGAGRIGLDAGHLIIAAARACPSAMPLSLVPSPTDGSGPQSTIASWTQFPHSPPSSLSIFGLRTTVDQGQFGNGRELFQTLCATRAAGIRSVLLSRWAVGGQSTAELIGEYVQELPFVGMNDAWVRSRQVLRQTELDPTMEPLLTKTEHGREGLNGSEPLFWVGYLVSSPD